MIVITALNEKGGVGKTTVAVHIAAGLAMMGWRVVLMDADAQSNAGRQLAGKNNAIVELAGLYDLVIKKKQWDDVLQEAPMDAWATGGQASGELWVLTSNIETRAIPMLTDDAMAIQDRISELEGWADVVVIDTSPTPSMLHSMVYMATTHIIHPTECEALSLEGIAKTIEHMDSLNKGRSLYGLEPVRLLGVQPTMYDVRTNAHDYGLRLLAQKFKHQLMPAIPVRTAWRDASWARKTVFANDPTSQASLEAYGLVERVAKALALEVAR